MPKDIDDFFADWEADAFGRGYGTGEPFVLDALAKFFAACREDGTYQHDVLEAACGPAVAWLLINRLCQPDVDVIDYGTSPRFGWLNKTNGLALRDYFASHTVEQLVDNVTDRDMEYVHCMHNHCNCDDGPCVNPFFSDYRPRILEARK